MRWLDNTRHTRTSETVRSVPDTEKVTPSEHVWDFQLLVTQGKHPVRHPEIIIINFIFNNYCNEFQK